MVGVLDYRIDLAFEYTADLLVGHLRNRLEIVDQVLNSCLGFVRQLVAVACKNLDAVVLKGVVACGNDNTRICLVLDGEESDRRRRDNAEQLYIRANRADARDERVLQHIRGYAGVLADQQLRLAAVCRLLRKCVCRCRADLERQQCIKFRVRYTANAVCSKISTQMKHLTFLYDKGGETIALQHLLSVRRFQI